jgi:hypothetical protein
MDFGRSYGILHPAQDDLFHLAPVPVIYKQLDFADLDAFNADLMRVARESLTEPEIEVPDVRHIDEKGIQVKFDDDAWSETQIPAIGVWHGVPTNSFLDIKTESVARLRGIIEERYQYALRATEEVDSSEPWISESWIQFYKDGDYKVLHNHERYGPPYPAHRWSGAYYLQDGEPDDSMPYAGMFSFRVRQTNYYIRPKAGLLLLWPADILHEVAPFYGKQERVVVNFNINAWPLEAGPDSQGD